MANLGVASVVSFWRGRRVLVTGHTGFKGSWLSEWLLELGADVAGLALPPEPHQLLFGQLKLSERMDHTFIDIRDADSLARRVVNVQPEVVFHMAASPLVLASYDDPISTWATNVQGSLHLMQALRALDRPCAAVMITTDKVYENREWIHPYRENDRLGGSDPYSSSKAAMEIAIAAWRHSFFQDHPVRLVSVRAGNVIGGGDWAENRIVPDIVRALQTDEKIKVRHPDAVRPFQHVLEPLSGYLRLATRMLTEPEHLANAYNFGPQSCDVKTVSALVEIALQTWPGQWVNQPVRRARHEAGLLNLGTELARNDLGYAPRWDSTEGIVRTMQWYRAVHEGADPIAQTQNQIREFGAP